MFVSTRILSRLPFAFSLSALATALAVSALQPAVAQGTRLWTQSRLEEFEKGTPAGVELTSDGHLRQGPGLSEVLTTPSTFVWSVAADKSGTAYLGTASPATVLRVNKDGKPFTLFETKDVSVQVVRLGPDGALYAATLPSGKVYKLKADATEKKDEASATVVFDAAILDDSKTSSATAETAAKEKSTTEKAEVKSHYIWDLTFDSTGRLYIATGGLGAVYRVDPSKSGATPERFFSSDEEHIRCLAWDAKGNLIAGSDGSGLVYRIDAAGKGYVIFESPRREITALAVGANGTIYAASVGDKSHNPLPPLPVQAAGNLTVNIVQPGSLQAANASTSLPEGTEIYALAEGRAPRKQWAGKEEIVYALAANSDGLMALSGNQGRVLRIADDGSYSDIAHVEAQQGLSMTNTASAGGILIGTGNTGKLYLLSQASGKHEYASDVLDTGALTRFGRVEVEPGSASYELLTRTGNVEQPVRGWSSWQPLADGKVASSPGRFLQWKAVLNDGGTVGSVGINYLPVNAAPVIDDLVVVTGARWTPTAQPSQSETVSIAFGSSNPSVQTTNPDTGALTASKDRTAITARWAAHDDNGDELIYALYLRGDGETVWRLLKDKITEKAYSFDGATIPDGGYHVKVVASDAPSHAPADALTAAKVSDRFQVDTAPPAITGLKALAEEPHCEAGRCTQSLNVTFQASDVISPIVRAEYSLDAGPWQYIEPVGKLSDSLHEDYEFHIFLDDSKAQPAEHLITVRAFDRFENVAVAKTVVPARGK